MYIIFIVCFAVVRWASPIAPEHPKAPLCGPGVFCTVEPLQNTVSDL